MASPERQEEIAGIVAPLLADNIITTVPTIVTVNQADIAQAISEITVETQTLGVPLLQLELIDPAWKIQRSGLCDQDTNGLVARADVNYPPGTNVWWRLAMVDGTNDLTQTNLTLTFQLRIVSYLQACFGAFTAPPGTTTRAQFIKSLVDRMPKEIDQSILGPGPQDIQFVCPQLNQLQPIAGSTAQQQVIVGPNSVGTSSDAVQASAKAAINKAKRIGAGAVAALTVGGQKMSHTQRQVANILLAECEKNNAPAVCWEAILYAGMGESTLGTFPGTYSGGGVLQGTSFPNPHDTAGEADAFLLGGQGFGNNGGGAIALANQGISDPVFIANSVEDNAVFMAYLKAGKHGNFDSYAHVWGGDSKKGIAEADAIINAYGGPALSPGATGLATTNPVSDVSQLARGTTDNPYEDSWTCMQRLASEVNWDLFGSPQPHPGQWGNFLYYISGTDLVSQKPSLYLRLSDDGTQWTATTDGKNGNTPVLNTGGVTSLNYSVDNTAFLYFQSKDTAASIKAHGSGKGRTTKKTRIRTPQTPTQVRFDLITAPLEFNAGDVFVFQNTHAIDGRWIVEDVTHNTLQDLFAQFTLGPPTFPYPEPQANAVTTLAGTQVNLAALKTSADSSGLSSTGTTASMITSPGLAAGAAQAAQLCLAKQKASGGFHYPINDSIGARPINYNIFGPYPVIEDCSGFCIACYKAAQLPDPSGNNYNGNGFTGDMITNCTKVSQGDAQPGDFCFFGPSTSATVHVNMYVGNGQSISMGREGDPSIGPAAQMGPAGFLGFFRSNGGTNSPLANPLAPIAAGPDPSSFFKGKLH